MSAQKIAMVFPGQGSQSIGMLNNVANNPLVDKIILEASGILSYDLGDIIKNGPVEQLNQTEITQPALLTASFALWKLWQEKNKDNPIVFAGHSLGEYTALVCAGVMSFKDAVNIVSLRGKYMQEAVPEGKGAMAAIIGLDLQIVKEICETVSQNQVVSAANINAPGQIVIAGDVNAVDRAMVMAKEKGAKLMKKLDVSVPSHCALMNSAAEKLKDLLENTDFNNPQIPVIQNNSAKSHQDINTIKQDLFRQLSSPVQWVESMENMVRDFSPDIIVECGPGRVLAGLNKRIVSVPTISIEEALQHV